MFAGADLSVVLATIAASIVMLSWLLMRRNGAEQQKGKQYPPSISALPLLIAIIREGVGVMPDYFRKLADKLGPVLSCKLGGRLTVILNSREALTEALVKQSETFADRVEFWAEKNVSNRDLRGIVFSHYNESFKKNRKTALSILKEFGFGVSSVSETRILQEVESLVGEIVKTKGLPFSPNYMADYATANVVLSILFGRQFMSVEKNHRDIIENVHLFNDNLETALNMLPLLRFLPSFRRKVSFFIQGNQNMLKVIGEAIKCVKAEKTEPSFVKRYLEIEGPGYDHQELLYILRDLCLGSSETVTAMVQWALVDLANHPAVQDRLQREIDDVIPFDRYPSFDDKPHLPYTEAVILELLRRRTVVPFALPRVPSKDTEVLGHFIPKGSLVLVNTFSAHMSPKAWKDPENFDPERFLDKDNNIFGSDRVLAFGYGKRSCPGEVLARQELFLFFTSLVQRFNFLPPEGQKSISVKEIASIAMRPSEFKVRMIPREKP